MDPIVLGPNQPPRFYRGGERIAAFRGTEQLDAYRPEDWVASTTTLFGEPSLGLTTLPDGRTLREAIDADPEAYLGAEHVGRYGRAELGLLVKLLDAGERLPVHAHPDRGFSARHLDCPHGKTEAWLVIDADPGAHVYLGFDRDVSERELASWVETQDAEVMLDVMHRFPVEAGDAILVPAGTPHAIGVGVFLVELQEPTDLSVLLEWTGFDLDGERDGHLGLGFATALSALERRAFPSEQLEQLRLRESGDHGIQPALPSAASPYFRAEWLRPGAGIELDAEPSVLVGVDGDNTLETAEGSTTAVGRGATVLVPFATGPTRLEGDGLVVRCRPAIDPPVQA